MIRIAAALLVGAAIAASPIALSLDAPSVALAQNNSQKESSGSSTAEKTLAGGAIGAAGGALLGAIGGNAVLGAAIGGGAGLLGGFLSTKYKVVEREEPKK